jgi:hypothetical protein
MSLLDRYSAEKIQSAEEGGFRQFDVGENKAVIVSVKDTVSQAGNAMLKVTFKNQKGAEITDFIVDGDYAAKKLKNLMTSFKIAFGDKDLRHWIGRKGIVVCKAGDPNDKYEGFYNRVSHYRTWEGAEKEAASRPAPAPKPVSAPPRQEQAFTDDIPF